MTTIIPDDHMAKARHALLASFTQLVLSRRYAEFGVGCITRSANVARSTFYYHFTGKDALLLANLEPLIDCIASLPWAESVPVALEQWTAHIWQHRHTAARLLSGRTGTKVHTAMAEAIRMKLITAAMHNPGMTAEHIAGASMGLLRAWVEHRYSASSPDVADTLWRGARSLAAGNTAKTACSSPIAVQTGR